VSSFSHRLEKVPEALLMNIVIADDGAPQYFEPVEFSTNNRVGGAASIVGYVPRQEYEAHRTRERSIDLIHNLREIETVLLASLGHVKIAKVYPADNASCIR
jgi:hypothetical protein